MKGPFRQISKMKYAYTLFLITFEILLVLFPISVTGFPRFFSMSIGINVSKRCLYKSVYVNLIFDVKVTL